MALDIRKSSSWRYGVFMLNGQRVVINLGVPITGKRLLKRTMTGDDEFERSRGRAQEAHDRQERRLTVDRNAESALRKLVEINTGKPAGFPKLAELPKLWLQIPRRRTPGKHYVAQCTAILHRFVMFVETSKTGERVDIPNFPLLREELERAEALVGNPVYCFPTAAEMYQSNPDGISVRVKKILARAFELKEIAEGRLLPAPTTEEVRAKCVVYLAGQGDTTKASRMRVVLGQYLDGASIDAIVKVTDYGQGTVPAYLNELQKGAGAQLIRSTERNNGHHRLQAERPNGLRRASIRDFHSFRVTWITLALAAGVPLELVQRVTGHRTVEVVMKHYFRPGREDFRQAILRAMPKMLADGDGRKSVKEEILALVDRSSARTWKADMRHIRQLVANLAR